MKPVIRYQSQLLFRKLYKLTRAIRLRTLKPGRWFRHSRAGPQPKTI
jgi:hypothetical protein